MLNAKLFITNTSTAKAKSSPVSLAAWSASIFDGKYLYMAPVELNGNASGRVERYDSTQTFAGGASPGLCQNAGSTSRTTWYWFNCVNMVDTNR